MAKLFYSDVVPGATDWMIGEMAFVDYKSEFVVWGHGHWPPRLEDEPSSLANVQQTRDLFKAIFNSSSIEIRT